MYGVIAVINLLLQLVYGSSITPIVASAYEFSVMTNENPAVSSFTSRNWRYAKFLFDFIVDADVAKPWTFDDDKVLLNSCKEHGSTDEAFDKVRFMFNKNSQLQL